MGLLGDFSGGYTNDSQWTQRVILGAIMVSIFMPIVISLFAPQTVLPNAYQDEIDDLMRQYNDITGHSATMEEIWGLSGIYTPYGIDEYGKPSTKYGITDDGWIYGARIGNYTPSQYSVIKDGDNYREDPNGLDSGKLGYVVTYDGEKGLYYYKWVGADLKDDGTSGSGGIRPASSDYKGDLYTRVHMDVNQQSSIFITSGGKHAMDNGTFYYEFDGYRYSFSPLESYKYSKEMQIDQKTSSCSLIWYRYTSDSGIQGQLVQGTDRGLQYITGASIVRQFDAATNTAKFTMQFNGVDVYVYVMLDPFCLNTLGWKPDKCYNEGCFSLMVTTPKYNSTDGGGFPSSLDPGTILNTLWGLFTFNPSAYGFSDAQMAGMIASIVFSMAFYSAMFVLFKNYYPIIIGIGVIQLVQSLQSSIGNWWPF